MKTYTIPLVLAAVTALVMPVTTFAQTSLALASGNSIYQIDTATGNSTLLHTDPGRELNGLSYSSSAGLLYVVDTTAVGGQEFLSLDPNNPSAGFTSMGVLRNTLGVAISAPILGSTTNHLSAEGRYLGIAEDSRTLYGWDLTGGNAVWQYDLNTGSTGWANLHLGDLIITNDGELWISATNAMQTQTALLRYSSVAAAQAGDAPTVLNHNVTAGSHQYLVNGLGYDSATDTLYGYQVNNGRRFGIIDQGTGSITTVINNSDVAFTYYGDLSDTYPTPVPEPSGALLVAATGTLALLRRRRVI